MNRLTVSRLAKVAGVSVRTLHYYDEIGLLRPSGRTPAGYRQYDHDDLLRLQQIMLYRELGLSLKEIFKILNRGEFDPIEALKTHRIELAARLRRLGTLIETVDKTIDQLEEGRMTITDEELFSGFTPEQAERYRQEARERWGEDRVEKSEQALRRLSKAEWQRVQQEGGLVTEVLSALVDRHPADEEVQQAIARHHDWIENFYPAPAEVYLGLAQMYVEHPEFRAFYEGYAEGLAEFMASAMKHFAENQLV